MTLVDRTIIALREAHDDLVARVPSLDLAAPTQATEWDVAQVLSHLGSASEIGLLTLQAAIDGDEAPGDEVNQAIWQRWDALDRDAKAAGFLEHETALLERVEALTPEQRSGLHVKLGFLPMPLPVESILGMRLAELTLHSWDITSVELPDAHAQVLAEHYAGGLGFLFQFLGKADEVEEAFTLRFGQTSYGVSVGDAVLFTSDVTEPGTTVGGPLGVGLRTLNGRLRDDAVTGDVDAATLRRVFPGY